MATTISAMFAALAGASIVGVGDQYLALFMLGLFTHLGWVQPAGASAFVGEPWFLLATAAGWAITTLPSLLPHHPWGTLVNALSGPVTLISGALFALTSAGIVASIRPEFVASLYLLSHDARWTQFSSYGAADVAVLAGGAMVASSTTLLKFLAKPGIALKTGMPLMSGPMFATLETGAAVTLAPIAMQMAQTDPTLLVILGGFIMVGVVTVLVLSFRWLMQAGRGIGRLIQLLDENPRAGLSVLMDGLLPGAGWTLNGYVARGGVTLAAAAAIALLAFTIIGLIVAIPAYLLLARASAVALYRRLTEPDALAAPTGRAAPARAVPARAPAAPLAPDHDGHVDQAVGSRKA